MNWIKVEDELAKIDILKSRIELPMHVILNDGTMTIADYTKSLIIDGQEWVGVSYKPIWICRKRGCDNSGEQINVAMYQPLPEPPNK